MKELEEAFSAYIEEIKLSDVSTKRREIINSIKELIAVIQLLANSTGIELHYLKSKEILDLENIEVSENDFLEAIIVYIENAKSIIGEYLDASTFNSDEI